MRGQSTRAKVERFMEALARSVKSSGKIYLTGGASAVLLGWRESTLDIDLKVDPEPIGFFEALATLKNSLDINVELASPDDFVPALPGWKDRCVFIASYAPITFFHYDFYGQALSKIERFHDRDQHDVRRMIGNDLVKPVQLLELLREVETKLLRYPAINPPRLFGRTEALACGEWPTS